MKLFLFVTLLTVLALSVRAVVLPQKAIIVSYPDDTPERVLDEAMSAIKAAGGVVTHEYKLIKGFAAMASTKAVAAVQALNTKFEALIEEDAVVSISSGSSSVSRL